MPQGDNQVNMTKKTGWKWLGALLLAAACLPGRANALLSANLNIDVTISASKSVSVNATSAPNASTSTVYTWNGTPNAMVVNTGTAAVQNTSGILSETWWLSTNATSLDAVAGGGQTWALGTSTAPLPGADTFALQAVFGSSMTASCPIAGASEWDNGATAPLLTTSLAQYTSTTFADAALNTGGNGSLALYKPNDTTNNFMFANSASNGNGNRALCYRAILPSSTSKTDQQIIQIVVTAQ
jgi:hypothetical protein